MENIRPGDAIANTRKYFDSLLLEQRLMDTAIADTTIELFGKKFDTPIMTTALSHLKTAEEGPLNGMQVYAVGAKMANTLHWVGMCDDEDFEEIAKANPNAIRIIKPYKEEEKILQQIKKAKEQNYLGVGMDIDHVLSALGEPDIVLGEEMEVKTLSQYRQYVEEAKRLGLPFIIKGVLSASDAIKAAEIGAAGIWVSHHNGRLSYAVPPLMVLPDIAAAVKRKCKIFVDCGICSGIDAYKALALGADAVGVGKFLMPAVQTGRPEEVCEKIVHMTKELRGAMSYTGVKNTSEFDSTVIHKL